MRKGLLSTMCFGVTFALLGCGGSSTSSLPNINTNSLYKTTLPDGSPMIIDVMENSGGFLIGAFSVSAISGPYADQAGAFGGHIDGRSIQLDCTTTEGDQFTLSGTATSNGFDLSRSDIPGTVLSFLPVTPPKAPTRSNVSFKFNAGGKTGQVSLSSTPVYSDSRSTEYGGSCNSTPIYVTFYSDGKATIIWDLGRNTASAIAKFTGYRFEDISTKTITATSGHAMVTTFTGSYLFDGVMKCSP